MTADPHTPDYAEARALYVAARSPLVPTTTSPAEEFDRFLAQVRAEAIRAARAAFYELHEVAPTLKGALGPERVGAHHATNVCMDFLTRYADEQETTR